MTSTLKVEQCRDWHIARRPVRLRMNKLTVETSKLFRSNVIALKGKKLLKTLQVSGIGRESDNGRLQKSIPEMKAAAWKRKCFTFSKETIGR